MKTLLIALLSILSYFELSAQQNIQTPISKINSVFKCHPNPVENELYILGVNKIKSVEFINVLGKRAAIYLFNKSIIKIDVSYLKTGIYILQVIDEYDKVEIKKLVVR
ncbi:T9SS type A sorting domain-containing protein [Seonamhaeicola sp. MEBiC1930]|uniref:T9SS type A sorting domain-containing protein n=1 Tax=Seonamhaeicola sp. MEBiC01930 TaxID=2976768 RepID=UPI0032561376